MAKLKERERASKRSEWRQGELLTDHRQSLEPGLYFVSTPIGSARDITLRALDVLASADVLAAEDTRNTRRLMDIHGIGLGERKIVPYHDHNGPAQRPRLIHMLREGKSVAYVSDAGTPLVADPGYALARDAIAEGLRVFSAPGASALLSALVVAGLPTDKFFFGGFLPTKKQARRKALMEFIGVPGTLIFYESPKRVGNSLRDLADILGGDRSAVLCRELTKKFEEVRRANLEDLADYYAGETPKGEVVLLVGPAPTREVSSETVEQALLVAMKSEVSLRDAVDKVTAETGLPRKVVYQKALAMEKDG